MTLFLGHMIFLFSGGSDFHGHMIFLFQEAENKWNMTCAEHCSRVSESRERSRKELSAVLRPRIQRQDDQEGFSVRWAALAHDRMCLNLET